MVGDDGDGAVGATHDGALAIEGIGAAEIDDKAGVLRATHKGNSRADFNAESFVGLGVGNARRSCGWRIVISPIFPQDPNSM
jgi:hypothetical protein